MSAESNKACIRRLTETWNDRDFEGMRALYADEVVVHGDDPERQTPTELLESQREFFAVFPDVTATTEHLIAEEDLVVVHWRVTATHEGELHGVEPTGESVEYTEFAMYRLDDGIITEAWYQPDLLSLYDQLGVVDPPTA